MIQPVYAIPQNGDSTSPEQTEASKPTRLTVACPKRFQRDVRIAAALDGKSMQQWVIEKLTAAFPPQLLASSDTRAARS